MWLPEWLYERLPLLYVASGSLCLWFDSQSPAAVTSAGLLFGAALLTHLRRREARRPARSTSPRNRAR